MAIGVGLLDHKVLAFDPAQLAQPAAETFEVRMRRPREPADARALGLSPRLDRPRGRAAEQRDELAAFHSITSSASASNLSGIPRPSDLAVVRLITRSNLVG